MTWRLLHGDSRELLKTLPDASVDSVVTDPPAGIAFMAVPWDDPDAWKYPITSHGFTDGGNRVPAPAIGSSSRNPNCRKCRRHKRGWKDTPGCQCEEPDFDDGVARLADRDRFIAFLQEISAECLRVLKPGGHALVWSLPRTSHWTATALENAGFEVRDCVYHVFGQGFPKSLDISKAIDKHLGARREVVGYKRGVGGENINDIVRGTEVRQTTDQGGKGVGAYGVGAKQVSIEIPVTAPATDEAKRWAGWGTALKPAVETWWLCRKPVEAQNVAAQVLRTGTGAINIDACRVGEDVVTTHSRGDNQAFPKRPGETSPEQSGRTTPQGDIDPNPRIGRWPTHLLLTHAPDCTPEECVPGCPILGMEQQSPGAAAFYMPFWYTPKASPSERDVGLDGDFIEAVADPYAIHRGRRMEEPSRMDGKTPASRRNTHPTVKSIALMRYLVRLVTPKGGTVLDPFAGSGSTLCAAIEEGMDCIGIEREDEYVRIAERRAATCQARRAETDNQRSTFDALMEDE